MENALRQPQATFGRSSLKMFRELSKSGIVALVLISVLAGYMIGRSPELPFDPFLLSITLAGVMLLASGSSALNQYQERLIDAEMPRTASRPLPSGRITPKGALVFIGGTLIAGLILLERVGTPTLILGILAVTLYNGLYTLWWKRRWAYAAIPGAVPGALPILMGYAAATGNPWQPAGIYLFAILFFWQMPHFWVLAMRYEKDYALGGIPTLPVVHGAGVTLFQIVLWCLAYVGLALIAPLFLKVGTLYLVITLPLCLKLLLELRGFAKEPESKKWLRFFLWVNFSLILFLAAAAADLWGTVYLLPLWVG
jgi:protoheme IX farnesyltransferase